VQIRSDAAASPRTPAQHPPITDANGSIGCGLVTAAVVLVTILLLVAIGIPTGFGGR
jgi:hypothetical protein